MKRCEIESETTITIHSNMPDPRCVGLAWEPDPSALGLATMPDPRYVEMTNMFDLTNNKQREQLCNLVLKREKRKKKLK